ncbi:DUF2752 domain-containing protein [Mangrovibacterium marinum]|uniref:Uncharacterized protein DUF2752 n=1 Tax=Mangrovibacterium marinum TaxID=1639118 RepID=A0A2T5C527_9BACT|nr:DUF2752 domain-containing protein [Mangrovibacterium marinum]PTN09953.1 uncharacterized protein DUF2752 [Mangrovibacterium marinum]
MVIVVCLGFIMANYWLFDPATTNHFPSCPFKALTGLKCAGCGSQRALYQLLHMNIRGAWHCNPLLVVMLPYMLFGALLDLIKNPSPSLLRIRKSLYGIAAIYTVLAIIVAFWIVRNLIEQL